MPGFFNLWAIAYVNIDAREAYSKICCNLSGNVMPTISITSIRKGTYKTVEEVNLSFEPT